MSVSRSEVAARALAFVSGDYSDHILDAGEPQVEGQGRLRLSGVVDRHVGRTATLQQLESDGEGGLMRVDAPSGYGITVKQHTIHVGGKEHTVQTTRITERARVRLRRQVVTMVMTTLLPGDSIGVLPEEGAVPYYRPVAKRAGETSARRKRRQRDADRAADSRANAASRGVTQARIDYNEGTSRLSVGRVLPGAGKRVSARYADRFVSRALAAMQAEVDANHVVVVE